MSVAIQIVPDDTLVHHGILGQKWGKLNGPPYPLGSSDHSASEKKAGWRKSLDSSDNSQKTKNAKVVDKSSSDNQNNKKKGLTDKQKKAIKIGAAVVATAAVAGTAYYLAKSGKLDELTSLGKSKVDDILGSKSIATNGMDFSKYDSDLSQYSMDFSKLKFAQSNTTAQKTVSQTINGIKKLAKSETIYEAIKNANPNRGNSAYDNNCSACGIATFLRTIGYDVTAKTTGGKQQILGGVVEECFKGAKVIDGSAVKFGRSRQDAAEMLVNKFGNNASGVVSVQWKGNGGGHIFNWDIKDGIVSFFDGQANRDDSIVSASYWKMINPNDALTIARLDNADIDFDAIKKYVENR